MIWKLIGEFFFCFTSLLISLRAWLHPADPKNDLPLAKWYYVAFGTVFFPVFIYVLQIVVSKLSPNAKAAGTPPGKKPVRSEEETKAWITIISSVNNLIQTVFSIYCFAGVSIGIYNNWYPLDSHVPKFAYNHEGRNIM